MDFFQAQESARSRSRRLVLLFIAAVVAIVITIYAVVHVAIGPGLTVTVDWGLLLLVALGTTVLVLAGSTVRTIQLRQGGSRVAEMLGGRRVRPNTTDEAERRLVNVVEEMAIAAGTPVPSIFVLDSEMGINAFAAGYTLDDAAIAVSHGTLAHLNRDELQGVIAHEFSHVLNGDMRLNIRLIGLLFGILLLAVVGRSVLYGSARSRGRRNDAAGQAALIGIALVVVGYIGVFFGRMIQAAVSRQREYLADAAAVQFTRNPSGIAGALKKIGAVGSGLRNPHAQEASHLFFASGLRKSFIGLLSTHPPLVERIQRIDPTFDGQFPKIRRGAEAAPSLLEDDRLAGATMGLAQDSVAGDGGTGSPGSEVMASIGTLEPQHVAYASRLLRSLPDQVRDAAHDPDGAQALLLALLLHDERQAAATQREAIERYGGSSMVALAERLSRQLAALGREARLPLLDVLLPAIRGGELSPDQAHRLHATARDLVAADGRMDVFELALLHVLGRQLMVAEHDPAATDDSVVHSFPPLRPYLETVLSALAWSGADPEADGSAEAAFTAGAASLPSLGSDLQLRARTAATIEDVDEALSRLRASAGQIRRRFLEACVQTVSHDGLVHVDEGELLRAVAEALDCPMPPLVRTRDDG